eukprot:INCI19763.1.p1 GENE.INCI19763.1~~INCI19763.1.p1  ORF type:complete len:239 (+),score=33.48 INCI19763.1:45-719(+)
MWTGQLTRRVGVALGNVRPYVKKTWLRQYEAFWLRRNSTSTGDTPGEQLDEISKLLQDNLPVGAIADKLAVDVRTVHRRVQQLVLQGDIDDLFDAADNSSNSASQSNSERPEQPMELVRDPGVGRVVLNHSTHCDELIPVLQDLANFRGIRTITPGRVKRVDGHVGFLNLKVADNKCSGGFRLTARRGTTLQEVFVTCTDELSAAMLQCAIDIVLEPIGGGRRR